MPKLSTPMHYLFLSPLLELHPTVHPLLTSGLEVATLFRVPYPILRLISHLTSHRQLAGCWGSVHSFSQISASQPCRKGHACLMEAPLALRRMLPMPLAYGGTQSSISAVVLTSC